MSVESITRIILDSTFYSEGLIRHIAYLLQIPCVAFMCMIAGNGTVALLRVD